MLSLHHQPITLIIERREPVSACYSAEADARDREVVATATKKDDANGGGWTMTDFARLHDGRN